MNLPSPYHLAPERHLASRKLSTSSFLCLTLALSLFPAALSAQAPAKVDYANDVQPILRENCYDCHGPDKHKGDMRLDRKSSALKPFARRVVPGNSANSMVYHRLIGDEYGAPMPPKGAIRPEQIDMIKAWIDQGANWPDALANEQELPPLNPKAVAMVEALRNDDLPSFMKAVEADPSLLNARGPEGSTPFMYAVLYSDTSTLTRLLQLGADPNQRNDANATALMWAASDFDKTRLLVNHGADVNARSNARRTPLMIAARRPGASRTVKFLLDKGANPNPNSKAVAEGSPLLEALTAGDEDVAELLLRGGADAQAAAEQGLTMAVTTGCQKILPLLAAQITNQEVFTIALQNTAVFGDPKAVRLMLDHGAEVNAYDPFGKTPLMYAAISDLLPVEAIKLLIERGADVNTVCKHAKGGDTGLTVLDIARLNGNTPVVELLVKSGAKPGPETSVTLHARHENSIRRAVQDSLPLLQHADFNFAQGAGCTSCHNNSVEAMTTGLARKRGFRIDEQIASTQVRFNIEELQTRRDKLRQAHYAAAVGDNFSEFILGYQLLGLHAEGYQPDLTTDAVAMFLQSRQKPNGEWPYPHADTRPPICLDYIAQTALAMRALQLYAPKVHKAAFEKSIRLAAAWLAKARSYNNDDRSWRLTGLAWAGTDKAATKKALEELLAAQRPDGGWSDLPSMPSSAYATGRSLVAMQLGGLPVSDPACQRGIQWLLANQQEDGSWYTKTRALGFQPYFETGFPHRYDQFMSATATSWAAMALALALPDAAPLKTAQLP